VVYFTTIYHNTFSALALIILFSVLPIFFLKKADLYVEKLEYSVKVAKFELTPHLTHAVFDWFNLKYNKYFVKVVVILLYLIIICRNFQNQKLWC
jgi:hypothetical protein